MAAYTLGLYFANSMRVPMQDCSELLMRCSHFNPEVPDSHPAVCMRPYRLWTTRGGMMEVFRCCSI